MAEIHAAPYPFFCDRQTALLVIDMQRDFLEPGGFGAALGNDVTPLRNIVPTVRRLLDVFRARRLPVIHTKEGHAPDLTDCPPAKRARGLELATRMVEAAHELGTENLLVVPGAVHIPWIKDHDPVAADVCDRRAREAVARMVPRAEKLGVCLNIENIFFSGYLLSPADMNAFVDSFKSKQVRVHFDTGNIMLFQFPEHWIPLLGKRIQNVHLKEFTKKGTDHSLESFRTLLDGTTDWPAVLEAFDAIGYHGYLTFEYFHPFPHYPEALIYQTSDALDRILGRKG